MKAFEVAEILNNLCLNREEQIPLYRIYIHLKQEAEPNINLRHLSYNAKSIEVKDNTLSFILRNGEVKVFNMDRISNFKVHKLSELSSKYAID